MIVGWILKQSHGIETHHASFDAALESLREVYGKGVYVEGTEHDLREGRCDRALAWVDHASFLDDDDGSRAVAAIRGRWAPSIPTPASVYSLEQDRWVPMSEIWPDAPARLIVAYWSERDGESRLVAADDSGSLEHCTTDYPEDTRRAVADLVLISEE